MKVRRVFPDSRKASRTCHSLVVQSTIALLFSFFCVSATPAARIAPQVITLGHVLRGHFVQDRQLAGFSKPLRSEGSFLLVPRRGLIWRGEKPFQNTTVMTSDGVLQVANGQETVRLAASEMPGLSHLYEMLGAAVSGNFKPLRQTFLVVQSAHGAQWKIVLTPLRPEKSSMAQLSTLILTGRQFVDSVEVDKSGGDIDRITFSDHNVSTADLTADENALLGALDK